MMKSVMSPLYTNFTGCFRDSNRIVKVSHQDDPVYSRFALNKVRELKQFTYNGVQNPKRVLETTKKGYYEGIIPINKEITDLHYHEFTELVRVREGQGDFLLGPEIKKKKVVDSDKIVRMQVRPGTIISIPNKVSHGFYVPEYMALDVIANSIEHVTQPLQVNKVDEKALESHKYLAGLKK